MDHNLSDIELDILGSQDIADAYHSHTPTYISSSDFLFTQTPNTNQNSTRSNQEPHTPDSELTSCTNPSYIQITTIPNRQVRLIWAESIPERIRVGSLLKINSEEELYEVVRVMKRSAKKETLLCMGNGGQAIGLIVDPSDFEQTWTNKISRYILFSLCRCFLS
jgi:hypothetical protein